MVEAKVLPGSVLGVVQDKVDQIEQVDRPQTRQETPERRPQGRGQAGPPPMAFTKMGSMCVDSSPGPHPGARHRQAAARADEVVSQLVELLPAGFAVALLHTQTSPQTAMAHWLKEQDPPAGFTVDRE